MQDKEIVCASGRSPECQRTFLFTVKDQEFYAGKVDQVTGKPWTAPKSCKPCREAFKREREQRNMQGLNHASREPRQPHTRHRDRATRATAT